MTPEIHIKGSVSKRQPHFSRKAGALLNVVHQQAMGVLEGCLTQHNFTRSFYLPRPKKEGSAINPMTPAQRSKNIKADLWIPVRVSCVVEISISDRNPKNSLMCFNHRRMPGKTKQRQYDLNETGMTANAGHEILSFLGPRSLLSSRHIRSRFN